MPIRDVDELNVRWNMLKLLRLLPCDTGLLLLIIAV